MQEGCPEGYIPCDEPCPNPNCGGGVYRYIQNGPHMEVRCALCGTFIKSVPKEKSKNKLLKWQREVKERDKYVCQRCGKALKGDQLHAHHKLPAWWTDGTRLSGEKYKIENGITLCKECHKAIHGAKGTIKNQTKGGNKNAKTQQF